MVWFPADGTAQTPHGRRSAISRLGSVTLVSPVSPQGLETPRIDPLAGNPGAMVFVLGVAAGAASGTLDAFPHLAFLLQMVGLGTTIGVLVAFVKRLRNPETDVWTITSGGTLAGFAFGLLAVALDAAL